MIHELKTDPHVFEAVWNGLKCFEIRYNDRKFQEGDLLILRQTVYSSAEMKQGMTLIYTGRAIAVVVAFILHGSNYGLNDGFVAMGFNKDLILRSGTFDA